MPSNWSNIPTEILLLIYEQLRRHVQSTAYVLVCKNWKRQLEPLIYSNVVIDSPLRHVQFNETLIHSNKGGAVEKIRFMYEYDPESAQLYKTTFDCLPRLQYFVSYTKFSYLPMIDAIMQGKLTNLKYIGAPLSYDWATLDNYATCVYLLKDQLEGVTLFDSTIYGQLTVEENINHWFIFYNRISQIMDLPHSFTRLTVKKRINDNISYVESIMNKCENLDTLKLLIDPDVSKEEASPRTAEMIRNMVTPVNTVKSLRVDFRGPNIDEFVYYLQWKFLKVDQIYLRPNSPNLLISTMCSLLILYLKGIPSVGLVSIPIGPGTFEKVVSDQANLLDNVSSPALGLSINYDAYGDEIYEIPDESELAIHKKRSDIHLLLLFNPGVSRLGLESVPFLKRYGRYIHRMTVLSMGDDLEVVSPAYLLSLFRNSPNLEYLTLASNAFYDFKWEGEVRERATLEQMNLSDCCIHEDLFVNMSRAVKNIRSLRLHRNKYYDINNKNEPYIHINMGNTTVGELCFHMHEYLERRYFFLHINTARHGDLYYVYDTSKKLNQFEISSKEQLNDITKADNTHLLLKFNDLTSIDVEHADLIKTNLKLFFK